MPQLPITLVVAMQQQQVARRRVPDAKPDPEPARRVAARANRWRRFVERSLAVVLGASC
jgi:hypothetical protein